MSKNNFLKNSSKVLLVPSLLGSFVPQNTKAARVFELTAWQNNSSSFLKVWTITLKMLLASWLLSFREFLFSKNKTEAEEKSTQDNSVKLDKKKAEELEQLQSALEEKFGSKINFWPYEGREIPGTVELHGGYELPFYIDVIDDKKAVIHIRNGGDIFFADEKDDPEAKPITEQFGDWCSTASKVLEQMEDLEKNGLFVKTVNKGNGLIYWEPTYRCTVRLEKNLGGAHKIYAIQYDPFVGKILFVNKPYYGKILRQLSGGHLELNLGNSPFGVKKEYSIELFESIISKIESDYDKHDKKDYFETTVTIQY